MPNDKERRADVNDALRMGNGAWFRKNIPLADRLAYVEKELDSFPKAGETLEQRYDRIASILERWKTLARMDMAQLKKALTLRFLALTVIPEITDNRAWLKEWTRELRERAELDRYLDFSREMFEGLQNIGVLALATGVAVGLAVAAPAAGLAAARLVPQVGILPQATAAVAGMTVFIGGSTLADMMVPGSTSLVAFVMPIPIAEWDLLKGIMLNKTPKQIAEGIRASFAAPWDDPSTLPPPIDTADLTARLGLGRGRAATLITDLIGMSVAGYTTGRILEVKESPGWKARMERVPADMRPRLTEILAGLQEEFPLGMTIKKRPPLGKPLPTTTGRVERVVEGVKGAGAPPPERVTGLQERIVIPERVQEGFPAEVKDVARTFPDLVDEVRTRVSQNPLAGTDLVNELKARSRPLNDFDVALLLNEKIRRIGVRDAAIDEAQAARASGDATRLAEAQGKYDAAANAVAEIFDVSARGADRAITKTARGLSALRMMADEDFSLVGMERRKSAANGFKPLTGEEHAALKKQFDDLQAKSKALAARVAALESGIDPTAVLKTLGTKATAEEGKVRAAGKSTESIKTDAIKGIKDIVDESKGRPEMQDLQSFIQKLALYFVRKGERTLDGLVDKVHGVVRELVPGVTPVEIRDAISGYGKVQYMSQEAAKVALRDLKAQALKVSQLEDAMRGEAPKKTGLQREAPSQRVRELTKQVNDMMKQMGIETRDPSAQLKSSLDAIKTRLLNAIEDIEKALAEKTRMVEAKTAVVYTPELNALKAKLDTLRAEYDRQFPPAPPTEAEQLAYAIERAKSNLEAWEAKLKDAQRGVFFQPEESGKPLPASKELDALRAQRDNARAEVERLKKVAFPPKTAAQIAEAARKASLQNQINDLEVSIRFKLKRAEPKPSGPISAEALKLREQRDALLQQYDEMFPPQPMTEEQRINIAVKGMERAVEYWEQRVKDAQRGVFGVGKPAKPAVSSPELETLKAKRDAAKAEVDRLKEIAFPKATPEEIALKSFKTRVANRIKFLEDKLERKDFAKVPRKEVVLDDEGYKLKMEYEKVKAAFAAELWKDQQKNRPLLVKIWQEGVLGPLEVGRTLKSSFDLSAFRQAAFRAIAHPVKSGVKAWPMMEAFASEAKAYRMEQEIGKRANAPFYARGGLSITAPGAKTLGQEEPFQTRWSWVKKIPGVGASERAFTTLLNLIRAEMFDEAVKWLPDPKNPTDVELKAIGTGINEMTGRGSLGRAQSEAASAIFWSPRLVASRFQLLAGHPLWGGTAATRKYFAGEYARFLVNCAIIYALGQAAGATIEDDPRSSDFAKLKYGNTRIDLLGGLAQATVFAARAGRSLAGSVGLMEKSKTDMTRTAARFARSKLSPGFGAAWDIISGKDYIGKPTSPAKVLLSLPVPLTMDDIWKAMKEQGVPEGVIMGILAIFGAGLQTYASKPTPATPAPKAPKAPAKLKLSDVWNYAKMKSALTKQQTQKAMPPYNPHKPMPQPK